MTEDRLGAVHWPAATFLPSFLLPSLVSALSEATLSGTGRSFSCVSVWQLPDCQLSLVTQSAACGRRGAAPTEKWRFGVTPPALPCVADPVPLGQGPSGPRFTSRLWVPTSSLQQGVPRAQMRLSSPQTSDLPLLHFHFLLQTKQLPFVIGKFSHHTWETLVEDV